MVLNDLLNLGLDFWCDLTKRDLSEERALGSRQVFTEFTLPAGDLVDGDRVQLETNMRTH